MLDILETQEARGIVYFPRGEEMTEGQIEKRLEPIRADLKILKDRSEPAVSPKQANWVQRNPWAPGMITALVGSGVLVAMFNHVFSDLDSRIDSRIEQKLRDHHFDEMATSVHQMEGQMKALTENVNLLLGKSIKQAASLSVPDFRQQLPQINGILNAANREKIPADAGVIEDLHNRLLPLVKQNDPVAWQATLSLASYRSVFNSNPSGGFATFPVTANEPGIVVYHSAEGPPPGEKQAMMSAPKVSVDKDIGARLEPIGQDVNPGRKTTNPYVVLSDGGFVLDGNDIQNAVFIGVHIVYRGGTVNMKNVTFVNCQFTIQPTDSGKAFIAIAIASERVTFPTG